MGELYVSFVSPEFLPLPEYGPVKRLPERDLARLPAHPEELPRAPHQLVVDVPVLPRVGVDGGDPQDGGVPLGAHGGHGAVRAANEDGGVVVHVKHLHVHDGVGNSEITRGGNVIFSKFCVTKK